MLVSRFRVDAARSRAAEARRYIEKARAHIRQLRAGGREAGPAESQLAAILPIIEQFEDHVRQMEDALGRDAGGVPVARATLRRPSSEAESTSARGGA